MLSVSFYAYSHNYYYWYQGKQIPLSLGNHFYIIYDAKEIKGVDSLQVIYAGYDVTNTKPVGAVVVEDGGELRIKANETVLTKDVEVKLGGTLKIDK